MSYEKNLAIATAVLSEIKERVTSSDDIIPCVDCPIFTPAMLETYAVKFGIERLSRYITLTNFVKKVYGLLTSTMPGHPALRGCPPLLFQLIGSIATSMMGTGDCGPTSSLAFALLTLRDPSLRTTQIIVSGQKPNGSPYTHQFVIIGEHRLTSGTFRSLIGDASPFKSLGADCVILDPLLNVVHRAQDIDQLEKVTRFYTTFKINTICQIDTIHSDPKVAKSTMELVYRTAETLTRDVRRQHSISPYVKDSLEMPLAAFEEAIKNCIRIYDAASKDTRIMAHLESSGVGTHILLSPAQIKAADEFIASLEPHRRPACR